MNKYILFYYNVKYKTLTNYVHMYKLKIILHFFGYKQKNLCSEFTHSNTKIRMSHINYCTLQPQCIKIAITIFNLEEMFLGNTQTTLWHFFFAVEYFPLSLVPFFKKKPSSESISTILYKLTLYLKLMALQVKCVYKYRCIY